MIAKILNDNAESRLDIILLRTAKRGKTTGLVAVIKDKTPGDK